MTEHSLKDVILKLYNINAFNFGTFFLRGGMQTPIYVDLRLTMSHPKLLEQLAMQLIEVIKEKEIHPDLICGVPYAAMPLSTCISIRKQIPMIMCRKEAKLYGTQKLVDGVFQPGQSCLVVDDVIVSGRSILETAQNLKASGLQVTDAAFIVDREQGGREILAENGIRSHRLISMMDIMEVLLLEDKIQSATVQEVCRFLKENNCHKLQHS